MIIWLYVAAKIFINTENLIAAAGYILLWTGAMSIFINEYLPFIISE